jgi:uncharacterized OB-fold protein
MARMERLGITIQRLMRRLAERREAALRCPRCGAAMQPATWICTCAPEHPIPSPPRKPAPN